MQSVPRPDSVQHRRPRSEPAPSSADQLVVSISDVEMGGGGVLDDFPHTTFLARLIEDYASARYSGMDVHLVFNGDTFDFLKMPVDDAYPTVITEAVALKKLEQVFQHHADFFEGVGAFLSRKGDEGHVYFILGNHDMELVFLAVQQRIREQIGSNRVHFPGLSMNIGDLHLEHGSQGDSLFRVDPKRMVIDTPHGPALALPWGAIVLLEVAMPMQTELYPLDRMKPRELVFELVPEFRDFVVGSFWQYWRDSARTWLGSDPIHQVSWSMVKELAYRFRTKSADSDPCKFYKDQLVADGALACITIGHTHSAEWWTRADQKLLVSGCFRNEFAIDHAGNTRGLLPKVYAEIYLERGRVVQSHLVEVQGPTPPRDAVLRSVFDVLSWLPIVGDRAHLAEMKAHEDSGG